MADAADGSLPHALQKREPDAWAWTYDSHAADVFRFIAHLLPGDRTAAEEIHQETWLAALDGIDGFDSKRGEFRAWIFGIARRQVALHFRRRSPGGVKDRFRDGEPAKVTDASTLLPHDVMAAVERDDAVRAALAELGAETRDVLMGKYVDGRSVEELAHEFGRSPKAIESLLSRARARMRALLAWYFAAESPTKDLKP